MQQTISRVLLLACFTLCSFQALAEQYTVPLLVPPGTSDAPQGLLRIVNDTDESGTVEIYAIDDAGTRTGPATLTLGAYVAVQFTATDLQSGNADLGLTGGVGTGVGNARLQIETDLQIVPLAFARAADGTLSAMHDTVRSAVDGLGQYSYEVPIFNPSTEVTHVSRLRLINPGDAPAVVTISGTDDTGAEATGGDVTLTIATDQVRTLTAQQLESGDMTLTGLLGAGTGRWRLAVSSDQPLQVVNIVAGTTGYWNNLSTTVVRGKAPADLAELSENFVGNTIVYETQSGSVEVSGMDAERFMQTQDSDGVTTSYNGSYGYDAVAPDTGRLILNYDNGDVCRANMYFSERRSGWFAWHCTGSSHPAEGAWDGGDWSLVETDDPPPADDDHGNTRESATVIGIPSDTPGELTSGDVDFFGIDVVEAGTLQVYTSGDTDTVGRLLDSGDSPVDSDDDSGTDSNFRIEYEVSSGTYFVRVEGFSSSDTGSYTLHVRLVSE